MENNQKQKVTDIHRNRNKQTYIEKKINKDGLL